MKRLQIVVLCAIMSAVTGCCPTRPIATSTRDSVRVKTVIRTEYIPDTVFIEIPVESERQTVRDTTSHLETSFAVSDAHINPDGSLFHSIANKPQKRPIATEKEVIHKDSIVYRDRTQTEVVKVERELTRWQKIQMRGFWVALVVLLLTYGQSLWGAVRKIFF